MLSPRYLDGLSDELVEIYSQLEADILQDMARRIKRLGRITEATEWQARMLAEAGGLKENIARTLKKYDRKIIAEMTRVYTEALRKSAENDGRIFIRATGRTVSAPNAQAMLATIQKCHGDLSRLTLTTVATSQALFMQQANNAYMKTQSGAFDYDTAMKGAADAMAERGITTVQYENGKPVTRTIESAVRMNILTGINQTAASMTLSNCEEMDCDLVETSAHIGARPEHEEWQGQVFSMSGSNPKYRPFSVCGLGSATGICGINCRHSFHPYFEGTERQYTQEDLDEMAGERVTYNGREMTRHEGEQSLRKIERQIRHYKRRALTEAAAGVDSTLARRKIGEWQARARDFTRQTGLSRDSAREFIGTADGRQPRGLKPTAKPQTTPPTATTPAPSTNATEKAMSALVDNPKSETRKELEMLKVEPREIKAFGRPKTEAEIISRIAGGDKTKGSCASLAHAYIANKAGFDVLDFRGGKSLDIFSKRSTLKEMAKFKGVKSFSVEEYSDFTAFNKLKKLMEIGKEYEIAIGKHRAIIRKLDNGIVEYLELQDPKKNGFEPFKSDTLTKRFACKKSYTFVRTKIKMTSLIVDIESLGRSREFIELMKYINTSEGAQLKGTEGYAK